jgi:hypothetical protein
MACKRCSSGSQSKFDAEINIHLPGYDGLGEPAVWIFPELVVCLECGFTEFSVVETELRKLENGAAA